MTNSPPTGDNDTSKFITTGDLRAVVVQLAWPTTISTVVITLYNLINRYFVGRLPDSDSALAAVGVGGTILMVQFSIGMGISIASAALVARFIGAREDDNANIAAGQGIFLSILLGLLTGIPLVIFARDLVGLVGARDFITLSTYYTAVIGSSSVLLFLYIVSTSCLRGAGDVKAPLYAGAIMIAVNVLLDWILIWGPGPFPSYGVAGAAWATVISRVAGMTLGLFYLKRSVLGKCFVHIAPKFAWIKRSLNIAWPAMVQNLMMTIPMMAFVGILRMLPSPENTQAQAALTVAISIESLAFMPGVAYSSAATPIVGQNLGAGFADRAGKGAFICAKHAILIMTIVAIGFLVFSKQLASFFTNSPAVAALIASYLVINSFSEPFLAATMVFRGALQGAGDTRFPAWITFICNFALRLPLAWLLAVYFSYGTIGAWIAMASTTVLSAFLMTGWFAIGKWKTIKV